MCGEWTFQLRALIISINPIISRKTNDAIYPNKSNNSNASAIAYDNLGITHNASNITHDTSDVAHNANKIAYNANIIAHDANTVTNYIIQQYPTSRAIYFQKLLL